MATPGDMLQFQAEHHPLEGINRFESLEQYCLHLMHLKAYEEIALLSGRKSVLDLGCNNGWGTQVIAGTALRVVGVDVSQSALNAATASITSPNVEFLRIDSTRLPFADGEFGLVASCQVIEHIADYGPYLSEILRVLSPDGTAVFTTPNARIRLDPGMKPWFEFHVREFSGMELSELLRKWFASVDVRGLQASQELYQVEYARVQRSRERARRRARSPFPPYIEVKAKVIDSVKAVLPDRAVQSVQGLVRRLTAGQTNAEASPSTLGPAAVPEWLNRYSTRDLYYTEEKIDESLDLMAVCRKNVMVGEIPRRKFV